MTQEFSNSRFVFTYHIRVFVILTSQWFNDAEWLVCRRRTNTICICSWGIGPK